MLTLSFYMDISFSIPLSARLLTADSVEQHDFFCPPFLQHLSTPLPHRGQNWYRRFITDNIYYNPSIIIIEIDIHLSINITLYDTWVHRPFIYAVLSSSISSTVYNPCLYVLSYQVFKFVIFLNFMYFCRQAVP